MKDIDLQFRTNDMVEELLKDIKRINYDRKIIQLNIQQILKESVREGDEVILLDTLKSCDEAFFLTNNLIQVVYKIKEQMNQLKN